MGEAQAIVAIRLPDGSTTRGEPRGHLHLQGPGARC